MCDTCGCHITDDTTGKIVEVHQSLLAANLEQAIKNK